MTPPPLLRSPRQAVIGVLSALILASKATAQIIENPKPPPSPNAGRVVTLRELSRTTEQKGKFFFVEPHEVITGEDGSVYVVEYRQFLKFDPAGRFVSNLLKKGDGPGELNDNLTDVIVRANDILLYSSNSLTLIRTDLNGKLLEDRRFDQSGFGNLLGLRVGKSWFLKWERVAFPQVNGIYESPRRLVSVSARGEVSPTTVMMPMTESRSLRRGGIGINSLSRLTATWVGDRDVYLFHSPDYLIKQLDLETGKIVRAFRRPYVRVPYLAKPTRNYPAELIPKFHNDLCRLLWHDGKLWAVTSTYNSKKGILVDVYSPEGKYLDNFWLPLFGLRRNNPQYWAPMAIHGNLLYVLEADEDDVIALVKYEIVGR